MSSFVHPVVISDYTTLTGIILIHFVKGGQLVKKLNVWCTKEDILYELCRPLGLTPSKGKQFD
jgi:hypothetical protein